MHRPSAMALAAVLFGALAAAQTYPTNYPPPPDNSYPKAGAIPEGTRFIVRLKDKLDSDKIKPGKKFKAELMEDLTAPNGLVILRGRTLKGHVSSVDNGYHGRMILSFDEIDTEHGSMPIAATVTAVPGEHGVKPETGPEGEISRTSVDKRRAIEGAAIGAAVGTSAGAAGGGGKGAAIGAAAGAGAGLGAAILSGRNLTLQKHQQLELRLDRPLTVPAH